MSRLNWNRKGFDRRPDLELPSVVTKVRKRIAAREAALPFLKLTGERPDTKTYLRSRNWYDRKKALFAKRGRICEVCCKPAMRFNVRILNWERFGYFEDNDLQIVCLECLEALQQTRTAHPPPRGGSAHDSRNTGKQNTAQGTHSHDRDRNQFDTPEKRINPSEPSQRVA